MRVLPARYSRKPQYAFHPGRALRRARYRSRARDRQPAVAELPWGLPLEVQTQDAVGFSVLAGGVFDPCVTETLYRLIDPGDLVVDAGANIGYLTSLAAVRAGPAGKVMAFEPHPRVFAALEANADRWRGRGELAELDLRPVALSDQPGSGELAAGPGFEANMGLAALRSGSSGGDAAEVIEVGLARLDDVVGETPIGLFKIDVEGHEANVLGGARRVLGSQAVRDIVFEDHDPYPSEATALVEEAGLTLIALDNDLLGLRLERPENRPALEEWPGPSYLATLEPERALERLRPRGWRVKGIGPPLVGRGLSRLLGTGPAP